MKKLICHPYIKKTGVAGMLLLAPAAAMAQSTATETVVNVTDNELLLALIMLLAAGIIIAVGGLLYAVVSLTRIMGGAYPRGEAASLVSPNAELGDDPGFWYRMKLKLTDAVPVEREHEVMTDHEYDGIWELDNSLPPWWKAMFFATIVFSVIYMATYHVFGWGQLQEQEYETELAEAKAQIEAYMASKGGALNESNVTFLEDEASLAEGKKIYDANCMACHGAELQGTVGPNLVDAYWIHGGSVGDIFKTIRDGVPSKGMIPWKSQLSAEQIQQVSSYIISMEGTAPAGAKEPQGELYER